MSQKEHLDTNFRRFLQRDTIDNMITKECDEVYSFPLLSESFCDKLVREVDNFRQKQRDTGIAMRLAQMGLDTLVVTLVRECLSNLISSLFPQLKDVNYEVYPKLVSVFVVYQIYSHE
jgi:hypothetical protein